MTAPTRDDIREELDAIVGEHRDLGDLTDALIEYVLRCQAQAWHDGREAGGASAAGGPSIENPYDDAEAAPPHGGNHHAPVIP